MAGSCDPISGRHRDVHQARRRDKVTVALIGTFAAGNDMALSSDLQRQFYQSWQQTRVLKASLNQLLPLEMQLDELRRRLGREPSTDRPVSPVTDSRAVFTLPQVPVLLIAATDLPIVLWLCLITGPRLVWSGAQQGVGRWLLPRRQSRLVESEDWRSPLTTAKSDRGPSAEWTADDLSDRPAGRAVIKGPPLTVQAPPGRAMGSDRAARCTRRSRQLIAA